MTNDLARRTEFAVALARRAGALGIDFWRRLDTLKIESKGHQDLVSEADREVELFVRAEIATAYPNDGIVGEEHAPKSGTTGFDWVIDPIDGTFNFVNGIPQWCVIIACAEHGVCKAAAIHEPVSNETFHGYRGGGAYVNGKPIKASAARSISEGAVGVGFNNRRTATNILPVVTRLVEGGSTFFRNASGGLMLAYTASGRLLGYAEEHMNAWDCIGGLMLIEEAGGRVVQPDPATVLAHGTVTLAGGPAVFDAIYDISAGPFSLPS